MDERMDGCISDFQQYLYLTYFLGEKRHLLDLCLFSPCIHFTNQWHHPLFYFTTTFGKSPAAPVLLYLLIVIISHMPCLICFFSKSAFLWMLRFLTSPECLEFLLSMTEPEVSNCLIFNLLKAKLCSRGL